MPPTELNPTTEASIASEQSPELIYVIGSINTDMVVKAEKLPTAGETLMGGEFLMAAGGKGGNQAVAASRGSSGDVFIVSCLGNDIFGNQSIVKLQENGINCDHIRRCDHPSGVALINVDGQGENQIVVAPGANEYVDKKQVEKVFQELSPDSIVLMQLEIPLKTVEYAASLARERNIRAVLDPAPAQRLPDSVYQGLFLVTPNETEAETLTGVSVKDEATAKQAAAFFIERGVQNVAVTLGKKGVFLCYNDSAVLISSPSVNAVDTTAAGDCFNGFLAAALAEGESLQAAVKKACVAASIAVTRMGAQDSMPSAKEVLAEL